MNLRRLLIAEHPLLLQLAAYLEAQKVAFYLNSPTLPYAERGDWRADIVGGWPPGIDRPRPAAFRRGVISTHPRPAWLPSDTAIASLNYFPPGGSGIGWHTDSTAPGWRVYIGRPLAPTVPGDFFYPGGRWRDVPGVATAFEVTGAPGGSWHAVRSEGPRFSVGIKLGKHTARRLGL